MFCIEYFSICLAVAGCIMVALSATKVRYEIEEITINLTYNLIRVWENTRSFHRYHYEIFF